ncbi:MAG: DUF481 domain-containing protein [Acidobacteriota bacterium]|nr:DUF481 domain-containing protein [Acidobacteriota bacterium]
MNLRLRSSSCLFQFSAHLFPTWFCSAVLAGALCGAASPRTAAAAPAPAAEPDVLVLSNGDTLHGKFVSEIGGKVTFHTDALGDVTVGWDKIKELHTAANFAIIGINVEIHGKKQAAQIPVGSFDVADQKLALHPAKAAESAPMDVKNVEYITDEATADKQINHHPSLTQGWNGAATAGASIVTATQNQYTFSGGIGLVRVVPTVSWLAPRDRTSLDFLGSYGKITQPAYVAAGVLVPAVVTKSAIYHADAERDEYFSPRFFALAQTAFDHNFGQDLDLQQIYGGGIGWTVYKTARQEADLKATVQYEKQLFITGTPNSVNLVGSTFAANYALHLKLLTYIQGLEYIPAYNQMSAYSANETNTFAFPAYKNLSFSMGTMDSYLNSTPVSLPPTKHNSFQFTMGMTYAIKSKY